jgi:hypothetical protein
LCPLERDNLNHSSTHASITTAIYIPENRLCRREIAGKYKTMASGICIAVVILTWVVQRLRLALSKGPNKVDVSPLHLRTETGPFSEALCVL